MSLRGVPPVVSHNTLQNTIDLRSMHEELKDSYRKVLKETQFLIHLFSRNLDGGNTGQAPNDVVVPYTVL